MQLELTNIRTVNEIMKKFNITFKKGLGQNFLINREIPTQTTQLANIDGKNVLEIGPGIGTLTVAIAKRAKRVVCLELDSRLIRVLEYTLSDFNNITVINQDVLKADLKQISTDYFDCEKFCVCANLPYYITTPVILKLIDFKDKIESITAMVQKEVAERFSALPGKSDCGSISLYLQYHAKVEKLFNVARTSFEPSPKVDSAVIKLSILDLPPVSPQKVDDMFKIIHAAFQSRRKTLVNCLRMSGLTSLDKSALENLVKEVCGNENIRGEVLGLTEYATLSDKLFSNKT